MSIKTNSNKRHMNYEYYIEQPMQMDEVNFFMIIAINRNLINSLHESNNHPLFLKKVVFHFNNINVCFKNYWWLWQIHQMYRQWNWRYYYNYQTFTSIHPEECNFIM